MKLTDAQAEAINKIAGYNGFDAAAALEFGAVADEQMEALRAENARLREELRELVALATVMARESADRVHNGDDCIDPARALLRELGEAE